MREVTMLLALAVESADREIDLDSVTKHLPARRPRGKRGAHNHRLRFCEKSLHHFTQLRDHAVRVPAFAGTTMDRSKRPLKSFPRRLSACGWRSRPAAA